MTGRLGHPARYPTIYGSSGIFVTNCVVNRLSGEQQSTENRMKYSLRTLICVLLAAGLLCAFYYQFYIAPKKADLPFATLKLDGELQARLWAKPNFGCNVSIAEKPGGTAQTITAPPKTGRSLFVEFREHEELIYPLREMDVDFEGPIDSAAVAYSSDRQFAAIYSNNNPDILILADLAKREFASPMTIWWADYEAIRQLSPPRMRSDLTPGPVRKHWDTILQSIRSANPELPIEWNCLK